MATLAGDGLLERELESAHLQRAVDHAWHGVGRAVVIDGPAGIGKTSLIAAVRRLAIDAGMSVRAARGAELEQGFAFAVVRQLFEPLIAGAAPERRVEWLSGAAALAGELFDAHTPTGRLTGQDSMYLRLHGLYWLCSNIARTRPLALCLDDAQWADEPSLAFFEFLARRLEDIPALIVVATRPVDAGAPDALASLRADPAARVLRPGALSPAAVERILALDADGQVDQQLALTCHETTGGNPWLVRELLRELRELGIAPVAENRSRVAAIAPSGVAAAVLGRLRRLSAAAPAVARAVAILGDGASLANVAALAGLEEEATIEAAAAMRAGELFADEAGLAFAHPIIRAALYDSVLPAERVLRHAQAARLLHERGAPPEQIAAQIMRGGEIEEPWVRDQLRLAAASALALGAPRNAVSYLRRALHSVGEDDPERPVLLIALGRAEALGGLAAAPEHLHQAIALTADPQTRARTAIALAELLRFTGRAPGAVELLSGLEPPADRRLADRVEIELLSAALVSHRAHELLAERIGGLHNPDQAVRTERERFELVLLAFEALLANRPVEHILGLIARAELESGGADRVIRPPQATLAFVVLTYCERFDEAAMGAERLITQARRRGSVGALVVGLSMREEIAYRRGDLADALADATEALELAHAMATSTPLLVQHPTATTNNVAVEQEPSERELRSLLDRTDQTLDRDTLHAGHTLVSRARLLRALGRSQGALDQLLAIGRLPDTYGSRTPAFLPWRSEAALLLHQLGDMSPAQRLASEELELARAMGTPRAIGIALRTAALVQTKPDLAMLEEAVSVLEHTRARLERARALVDLGAALRRAGQRARSRTFLRDGHELAVQCGATRLARGARHELATSGARIAPAGLSGLDALTPSERRVAELAAHGQSNRDIAQTLFITTGTVETHLRHAYDKLGVRSRHKLRELLADRGDPRSQ